MEASSLQSHFVNWQLLHRSRGMAKALDGREIVKVKLIPNFFQKAQLMCAFTAQCLHSRAC